MLISKAEQLRGLLRPLDPLHGAVHADDEMEISLVLRQRGVSCRRKLEVLAEACTHISNLFQPDPEYVEAKESSQETTDSQLELAMLDDEDRSQTPQARGSAEPDSLLRLRASPGAFGSPLPFALPDSPLGTPGVGAASSSTSAGRPPKLAAAGSSTREELQELGAFARNAPGKARMLFDAKREAAPEPTSHQNVVDKSNAAAQSIFEIAGGLNETIEVVSHMLQRAEMRTIIEHLGYSRAASDSDTMLVDAIASFIQARPTPPMHRAAPRLSLQRDAARCTIRYPVTLSPHPTISAPVRNATRYTAQHAAQDHLSAGGGSRSTDKQVAHSLLGKAASSKELLADGKVTQAARRLGIRFLTFRHLLDCRLKMDAEREHGVEVGALLKVSRLRREDARDDDAELFDDWSHRICRYDSTQTTSGKKVRRFNDGLVEGRVRPRPHLRPRPRLHPSPRLRLHSLRTQVSFEEHERRTLPGSRLELCKRFLESEEYAAFLERKESQPLNVSFFQRRICQCMVDEKMTQCADPIDTQFNLTAATLKTR